MEKGSVQKIFSKMPSLLTERLVLRKMHLNDRDDMYEYSCRDDVTKYLTWYPHKNLQETETYLRYIDRQYKLGEFFDWALELKSTGRMIGTCGFTSFDYNNNSAEIGYVLNPAYWGLELAAEAVKTVLHYGFSELYLHRIEAHFMVDNINSKRVMEKAGMLYEGTYRDSMIIKNGYADVGVCSILARDFYTKFPEHELVKKRIG